MTNYCANWGIVLVPSTDASSPWAYDATDCTCAACQREGAARAREFDRAASKHTVYCTACCRKHARCVCP